MYTANYQRAARRLAEPPASAHLVGIGGVGMAGLALLLARAGWRVSGCDRSDSQFLPWLAGQGIDVVKGHDPQHLTDFDPAADIVVRSTAVPLQSPELAEALRSGIDVFERGVMLAALLNRLPNVVAVCGAHGKTTTASFAALLARAAGLQPGWGIGGVVPALGAVAGAGADEAAPFVAECDESDGTLALYRPRICVVTNIDYDHMEHFADEAAFHAVFATVISQTTGTVIYNRDDSTAHRLCHQLPNTFSFGQHPESRLRAVDMVPDAAGTDCTLTLDGRELGRCRLAVPGLHNVSNALAALAVMTCLDRPPEQTLPLLQDVLALPDRRFDEVPRSDGVRVVSDYAHHPVEVEALISMARLQGAKRILALFQPHRYSRTLALGRGFPSAFVGADELLLLPVFAASEVPCPGGTSADLYAEFLRQSPDSATIPRPVLAQSMEAAWHLLRATVQPGDLVLIVGAGDVVKLAQRAADCETMPLPVLELPRIEGADLRVDCSAASFCTLGVGGSVRLLARIHNRTALAKLLAWCDARQLPRTVIGGGSNLLVPDTGYGGVLIQLTGEGFATLEVDGAEAEDGQCLITVGAACRGGRLLGFLEEQGLGGLEFMEGIPGTVGGWLAMNAGACGGEIGEYVESVEVLDSAGRHIMLGRDELDFAYRSCRRLNDCIVLSATLSLSRSSREAVASERQRVRQKRLQLGGLRTAGSVFRNPPGASAGHLLDQAGCKGLRVGGARITQRHANIIATETGATASDVLALATIAASRVETPLELEVRVL